MRRILKIGLVTVTFIATTVGLLFYLVLRGKAPIPDGLRTHNVEVVRDGYVSAYIIDLAPHEVALVDSGDHVDATAIIQALKKRGLTPDAVKVIALTHGDLDHVRGAGSFGRAEVMARSEDVDLAEGRRVRGPRRPHPTGVHVGRILSDGQVLDLSGVRLEAFSLPGHTAGSTAYLARGVLFLGDSADVSAEGRLEPSSSFFAESPSINRVSLRQLAARLRSRAEDVKAIACSHSGVLQQGLAPLTELADRLAKEGAP